MPDDLPETLRLQAEDGQAAAFESLIVLEGEDGNRLPVVEDQLTACFDVTGGRCSAAFSLPASVRIHTPVICTTV